ncbi:hypothetical protein LEP1GSC008_4223 [Leptospira kirschneri serovar Bulgarica str. Nikolaevo]|uniref:Uncharacterized protein n=1 Tax=Leptospira kirschneri serovar Bulgarica str. Nikolaevo TaxID=1240687 RepID=M6FEZ4_9LEPT|nr:hypothetical protein LEP1GSC008_4223 [Leptospira kirschneri serovar Bulgarica str. Nikolaevo]
MRLFRILEYKFFKVSQRKAKIFRIQLRFMNLITFPEIATILDFIREVS